MKFTVSKKPLVIVLGLCFATVIGASTAGGNFAAALGFLALGVLVLLLFGR